MRTIPFRNGHGYNAKCPRRRAAVYGLLVFIKVKEVRLGSYPLILLFQRELSRDGSWR